MINSWLKQKALLYSATVLPQPGREGASRRPPGKATCSSREVRRLSREGGGYKRRHKNASARIGSKGRPWRGTAPLNQGEFQRGWERVSPLETKRERSRFNPRDPKPEQPLHPVIPPRDTHPPLLHLPLLTRSQRSLPPGLARPLSLYLPPLGLQPGQPPLRHRHPHLRRSSASPETRKGDTLFPSPGSFMAPPTRFRPAR